MKINYFRFQTKIKKLMSLAWFLVWKLFKPTELSNTLIKT